MTTFRTRQEPRKRSPGLCDECALPKTPQTYIGYGIMLCLDCLLKWKNNEYAQTKTVRTEGDQGVEAAE